MKAKDLMIGDWVYIHHGGKATHYGKATALLPSGAIESEIDGSHALSSSVEPIQITPEILEKNGFEKLDFSHYHINNRALVLDADGKWDGPLSWHWVVTEMDTNAKGQRVVLDYYVATIKYVHELQHALRLCGIDKEIVV